MAEEIQERITQYREHAADALAVAARASPKDAPLYIRLAEQWARLVVMLEHRVTE